jgi:hypothetical protein
LYALTHSDEFPPDWLTYGSTKLFNCINKSFGEEGPPAWLLNMRNIPEWMNGMDELPQWIVALGGIVTSN